VLLGTRLSHSEPVFAGFSSLFALELIARSKSIHRIPVLDNNFNIVVLSSPSLPLSVFIAVLIGNGLSFSQNLITQSDLVSFFQKHAHLLGKKAEKKIEECESFFKDVKSVRTTTPVREAFNKMMQEEVTGLGVIDDGGFLVDCISLRDLKGLGSDLSLFRRLEMKTKEFCDLTKTQKLVAVQSQSTIADVISKMAHARVHRVFLTDNRNIPLGVGSFPSFSPPEV
jgi:CBS domain-containing protein